MLIRAYKFLMRPTVRQAAALGAMLREHCALYNAALQERRDAYRHASTTTVRYGQQSAQLKDIRTCPRPECGHVAAEDRPTQAKFHCVACGHTAHADTVGAINVLRAGLVRRKAPPA